MGFPGTELYFRKRTITVTTIFSITAKELARFYDTTTTSKNQSAITMPVPSKRVPQVSIPHHPKVAARTWNWERVRIIEYGIDTLELFFLGEC